MKQHLKSAVERFKKSKGKESYLINPISSIDAEIIIEIVEICKKLDRNDLSIILDGWKYNKDEQIRDDLLQWNIDNNMHVSDASLEGEDKVPSVFDIQPKLIMKIYDEVIDLTYIFHYNKIEEWIEDIGRFEYGIIFNEVGSDITRLPYFANKKIFFSDIEERDVYYDRFDIHYGNQDCVKFVD